MIVVTSGSAYLDIDAYAGCIAYAELLRLRGEDAVAISTSPLNSSVIRSVQDSAVDIRSYVPVDGDKFVMIDVSNREYLDTHVKEADVIEVIDHHPGHEAFWREKLGSKAQIEPVGAACTLVYEHWEKSSLLEQMNPETAKMLAAGILDNTLNFTAEITKDRDHLAFNDLKRIASLNDDFPAQYFSEVQKTIEANLEQTIKNDMKLITETTALPHALGQVVIWDAKDLIEKGKAKITDTMQEFSKDWAVNVISVSEGKTYFVATNPISQDKLNELFDVTFKDCVSVPHAALLRKEIIKLAITKN